jgi:hypothetical protein
MCTVMRGESVIELIVLSSNEVTVQWNTAEKRLRMRQPYL